MQPFAYNLTLAVLFAGAAAVGIWFLKWKKDWPLLDRVVAAPLAVGFVALLGMCASSVLQVPFFGWNAARLAPTFALVNGYRLYYPADTGPVLNSIYGPVTALVYLPATLAKAPTSALVGGGIVSVLLFFGPVVWLLVKMGKASHWMVEAAAFLCFGFITCYSYPLRYSAFCIHADAPALGLGGLACAVICLREREEEWKLLVASAVLAVLSVWAKQTMALMPVALAVWVLVRFGVASFRRYLLALCGAGLMVSVVFVLAFGPSAMFFNLFQLPSHHPWQGEKVKWLVQASYELLDESLLVLAVIVVGFVLRYSKNSSGLRSWRDDVRASNWPLFVLVGVFNTPAAVLNRVKIGGDMNALSVSLYFWMIGAMLLVVEMAETEEKIGAQTAKAALAMLVIGFMANATGRLKNLYSVAEVFRNNQQEVACRILRDNPGAVYFPNNPLAHLMTEGKLYHFSYGLIDRRLGGHTVTTEHFRAYVPPKAHAVFFGSVWPGNETMTREETMQYLPGFILKGKDSYGWTVYLRAER